MADNVIESFLVALGWKVDRASAQAADTAIGKTRTQADSLKKEISQLGERMKVLGEQFIGFAGTPTDKTLAASDRIRRTHLRLASEIKGLGIAAAATTTTFVTGFTEIAKKYEQLFYISQRTGVVAGALAGVNFGGAQIGKSAEAMQQLVNSMGMAMRMNPGLQGIWAGLTGGTGNIANPAATAKQQVEEFHRALQSLSKMPFYTASRFMQNFGWSPEMTADMIRNREVFYKQALKQIDLDSKAGLNRNKLLQQGVELSRDWNAIWAGLGRTMDKALQEVEPDLDAFLKKLNEGIDLFNGFAGHHPGTATTATLATTAAGTYGATKLVTGLGRRMLGGDRAAAVGAEGAGAGPMADAAIGGMRFLPGFAIGQGLGDVFYGHPDKYPFFQRDYQGPHPLPQGQRWWDKVFGALSGPFSAGSAAAENVLARGLPTFQHGGIVANLHPGEMVLPKQISDGLQALLGAGRSAGSRAADYLMEWLRGASGFRPYVQIDPSSLRGFAGGGDGIGRIGGGSGFHSAGWRIGSMTVGGALDHVFTAAAGGAKSGPQAGTIASAARAAGASDAAITAMLAGAMGEGGLFSTWKPGDHGTSFGPWQLHRGGELNRYLAEGNKPSDVTAQTRYVLKRLNEIHPGFSKMTDPLAATAVITRFEHSVQGLGYYAANIGAARRTLAGTRAAHGILALGDSIAAGVAAAGGINEQTSRAAADRNKFGIPAVWGRTSAQVMRTIAHLAPSLRGRSIALSSGASNDMAQLGHVDYGAISGQLAALRTAGAAATLLGVGTGVAHYRQVNAHLAALAAAAGIPFTGLLPTTEGGRVHPRNYSAVLGQIEGARLGAGVHHHHGDRNVTAHQTNHFHLAAGGAVPGTIRRAISGAGDRLAATIVRNSRPVLN